MSFNFGWDEAKAASNQVKPGVRFAPAADVFLDDRRIIVDATRPAENEGKTKAIGAIHGRLFTVMYTERAGAVRLIFARRSNSTEERAMLIRISSIQRSPRH